MPKPQATEVTVWKALAVLSRAVMFTASALASDSLPMIETCLELALADLRDVQKILRCHEGL